MEDEDIIRLYLNRDENAIRQTSEKYGSRLRAVSYKITGDIETSKECENDTYLEAWKRIPPNEPKDYFYAFLMKITRAVSIDRCRKLSRLMRKSYIVELTEELEMCIPAVDNVEDSIAAKLLGEEISRYLKRLSGEKQVMFIRRYFYLESVSEIAKSLSVSESKVKTTLFRVRNELRKHLIREGYTL